MTQPQRQRNMERVLFGRAIVRSAEKKSQVRFSVSKGRSATQGLVGFCSSSFWTSWSWCGCTLSVRAMTLKTLEPWNHATNRWSEVVSDHDLFSSCGRWSTTVLFPCSWFCFWAARKQNRFLAAFYISVFKWRCAYLLRLLKGPRLRACFHSWEDETQQPLLSFVWRLVTSDLWPPWLKSCTSNFNLVSTWRTRTFWSMCAVYYRYGNVAFSLIFLLFKKRCSFQYTNVDYNTIYIQNFLGG